MGPIEFIEAVVVAVVVIIVASSLNSEKPEDIETPIDWDSPDEDEDKDFE